MQHSISVYRVLVLCLVAAPLLAETGEEGKFQWSIGTDITYFDNIELLPGGGEGETVLTTPVALVMAGHGPRYDGNLWAAGQYVDYFGNVYPDDTVWGAVGDLTLHIVPKILDWKIGDNYGPFWLEPLSSDTPDNRAYVNYFETGPVLTIGANSRTRVVLDGSYARSTYSSEASSAGRDDLESWLGDLSLVRQIEPQTELSIHGVADHTSSLTDSSADSYNIYEGFLRLEATGGRTRIKVDGGVTHLDYGNESPTAPLLRLDLGRELTDLTTLSIGAGSGYTDSAASFVGGQDDDVGADQGGIGDITGVDDTLAITALDAPLKEDYVYLTLSFTGRLTTGSLSGGYYREEFESDSDLSEQNYWEYSVLIARQITDALSVSVGGNLTKSDYQSADQDDTYYGADAALIWRLGRALSLIGRYEWNQQNSNVSEQSYTASAIGVGVYYGFVGGPVGTLSR